MTINPPYFSDYDEELGIDQDIIDYIRESHEIESRISPVACYLLFQLPTGSAVGSGANQATAGVFISGANYRAVIWASGSNHPDTRPYTNSGQGSIFVSIDAISAARVLAVEDLVSDSEFAVVERIDLSPPRVELVFNAGFDASAHAITYYYTTLEQGVQPTTVKRGDSGDQALFGWIQYLQPEADAHRNAHQILVRQPLTTRDLTINEEGRVTLEENDCWMIWTPYVHDFDILIVSATVSASGREERYEVVNKRDSVIQRVLVSQRFKVKLLELSDTRHSIPYVT